MLGNKTAFHFEMPRKKVVRIADVPVEEPPEPEEPVTEPVKEPVKEPEPEPKPAPKKRQRAPPKSRMVRRTTQQMKKAQEIEYMVTRIANELRKDGWAAPAAPAAAPPPARRQAPPQHANRGTKQIELRDVLRRHNVPNKYRRAPGEYLQQYEEDEEEEEEEVAAPAASPYDEEEDDVEEDLFREPKAARFVPKTNDRVSSVYSQIFGGY